MFNNWSIYGIPPSPNPSRGTIICILKTIDNQFHSFMNQCHSPYTTINVFFCGFVGDDAIYRSIHTCKSITIFGPFLFVAFMNLECDKLVVPSHMMRDVTSLFIHNHRSRLTWLHWHFHFMENS